MIDRQTLFPLMAEGAVVITPTKRLSIALLEEYFQFYNCKTVKKPVCLPFQNFLRLQYHTLCFNNSENRHPLLLNSSQYNYLWQKVLGQQEIPLHAGLVETVKDAWSKCQRWKLDTNSPAFSYTEQTQAFAKWSKLFQRELDNIPGIVDEQLAEYLTSSLLCLDFTTSIWVCFEEYTPQQKALHDKLTALGCRVLHTPLNVTIASTRLYKAKNASDEYEEMILWIKERLADSASVGVVVPSLETEGTTLQRLLQRRLPEIVFSISLGQPLSDYPLIGHALNWLKLDGYSLGNHQARLLLHSPYLYKANEEFLKRAQMMQNSLSLQEEVINWGYFLNELRGSAPQLHKALSSISAYPETASPSEWASHFRTRLNTLGFPGDLSLNSEDYQCFQKLLNLFSEFKQLQLLTCKMTMVEAIDALTGIASNTIFQPKAEKSNLQIMGMLEATGIRFDALWVTGMTDVCLPKKIKPSPFIPLEYQRAYISSEHALFLAEKQFESFLQNAPEIIFSYAAIEEDKPQLPSPLLKHMPERTALAIKDIRSGITLEKIEETYQIPQNKESIKGSTGLLAKQSKCPFQAFAAHRLHAQQGNPAFDGLNPLERGQLVHKALECFWQQVIDQKRLLAMSEDELSELISNSIDLALDPYRQHRHYSFSSLIQQVEIKRLCRLLKTCLEWEKDALPLKWRHWRKVSS